MDGYATADQVWGAALVFARLGAILMLLPGLGETYVPPRIRLSLALLITLVVWPIAAPALPALPESVGGMAGWVIREVATGLMIGAILRAFMTALATAGEVVSLQTTLSFAQSTNPMQAQPGSTLSAFLTLLGVTKPVVLEVTFNGGYAGHPFDPNARVGFSGTGSFNRSDFGMGYGVPAPGTTMGVGDTVSVEVETEFTGPALEETKDQD